MDLLLREYDPFNDLDSGRRRNWDGNWRAMMRGRESADDGEKGERGSEKGCRDRAVLIRNGAPIDREGSEMATLKVIVVPPTTSH